jgi:sporulation protein YlmC with PRC-barrel domain
MRLPALTAAIVLVPALAPAQEVPGLSQIEGAAGDLLDRGIDLGADVLLIADLLGREVVGPDGGSLGTVEDFVLIPGGNLVAALIARPDAPTIALPYEAVSAGVAVNGPVEIPMTGAEIDGSEALARLSRALGL